MLIFWLEQLSHLPYRDQDQRSQEKYDNKDGYKTIIKDIQQESGRSFKVWLKGFKSEREARDYKAQGHFEGAFIVRED